MAESFFLQPPGRLDIVHPGERQTIEGIGNRLQMFLRQMQVDQGVFQAGVSEPDQPLTLVLGRTLGANQCLVCRYGIRSLLEEAVQI